MDIFFTYIYLSDINVNIKIGNKKLLLQHIEIN